MLTKNRLDELLEYRPEQGVFIWRSRRGKAVCGSVAGCRDKEGYRVIQIDGKQYRLARLAWLTSHGVWPDIIDHKNRNRLDDRLTNLRDVNKSRNSMNKTRKKGIPFYKGAYVLRIRVGGFRLYLGRVADFELAELASSEARAKYHGEYAV